jgi:hypothetical protein
MLACHTQCRHTETVIAKSHGPSAKRHQKENVVRTSSIRKTGGTTPNTDVIWGGLVSVWTI